MVSSSTTRIRLIPLVQSKTRAPRAGPRERASPRSCARGLPHLVLLLVRREPTRRQGEGERGPLARLALDADAPPVGLHDRLRDEQPETRADLGACLRLPEP